MVSPAVTNQPITILEYTGSHIVPQKDVVVIQRDESGARCSTVAFWAGFLSFLAAVIIAYLFLIYKPPSILQNTDASGNANGTANTWKCALVAVIIGLIIGFLVFAIYRSNCQ